MNLFEILGIQDRIRICDIGASPVDGDPPYAALLSSGRAEVTAFEPQPTEFEALVELNLPNVKVLPVALADGNEHTLHICKSPGMTSLLEPDTTQLALFEYLAGCAQVNSTTVVKTRRLDDLKDVIGTDFLKLDVQGSELQVLQNGTNVLESCSVVQLEASFLALYKNQPVFSEVDAFMRSHGFMPHCFADVKKWIVAPCVINNDPRTGLNQLLECDVVYIRNLTEPDKLSERHLRSMAAICHVCYRSIDVAMWCINQLESRGQLKPGSQNQYIQALSRPQ